MQNVKMSKVGNILTIIVDLSVDLGPSKTGKTRMIATTNGNASVPSTEATKVGLNIFKKVE
jgi:hypothetical protein